MLENQIRDMISRYLAGMISVDELEHDLPDGWELDRNADESTRQLALRVMGYVAEQARGDLDERELQKRLEPEASWIVTTRSSLSAALERANQPVEMEVSPGGTPHRAVLA